MSSRRGFTPEQIIGKLREDEVTLAQAQTTAQVSRTLDIAEQTLARYKLGITADINDGGKEL